MKITEPRAPCLNVSLKVLSPSARGGDTSAYHTLVVVDIDEGIRRIGECYRLAHGAMQTFIAAALYSLLMDKDLRRIEEAAE